MESENNVRETNLLQGVCELEETPKIPMENTNFNFSHIMKME
jgi:hypothetical protein